jgi:hypothetical protein
MIEDVPRTLSRIEINVKIILDAGSFKIQRRSRNV